MKFNELTDMMQKPEPKPDTYEAGMALNQLLKIGTHAIKIHNMIDDDAEMEAWVAKKIDLASNYVKSVHGYTAGSKAGTYDDAGMTEEKSPQEKLAIMSKIEKIKKQSKDLAGDKDRDLINKNKELLAKLVKQLHEDAGEGHMSKSQLYQTAKMAIELLDMINKGDDLEGWVQTKLNLAADYLQAVYHYEDYQKLNPYREELDGSLIQRHAGIIQKHLDEILERKCRAEDVDTKPGMMRILKKRVNEVEKEIAKENRKETNEEATIKPYVSMYKGKDGKMVYDVLDKHEKSAFKTSDERVARAYLSKNYNKLREAELNEGIQEWGKRLAMAGVIVAGLAGVNSINNAIDNSIPAVKAMNTALDMAQDSGNDELAKMIEKDLSDAKVRLSSGKDLTHVADLQDKYAKFMKTEDMAYETVLQYKLESKIKS